MQLVKYSTEIAVEPQNISDDRIYKYTGYKQIPGIILEINCNDEIQKKAVSIDDNCEF